MLMFALVNHEGQSLGLFSSRNKAQEQVAILIRDEPRYPIFWQEWELDNVEPNCYGLAYLPLDMKKAKYNAVYLSVYDGML